MNNYQLRGISADTVLLKVFTEHLETEPLKIHLKNMNRTYDVVAKCTSSDIESISTEELAVLYAVFRPDFLTSTNEQHRSLHSEIYDAIAFGQKLHHDDEVPALQVTPLEHVYPVDMKLYLKAYGLEDSVYEEITASLEAIDNFTNGWDDVTEPYLAPDRQKQYREVLEGYIKNIPSALRKELKALSLAMRKVADLDIDLLERVCSDLDGELVFFKRDGITELLIFRRHGYRLIL